MRVSLVGPEGKYTVKLLLQTAASGGGRAKAYEVTEGYPYIMEPGVPDPDGPSFLITVDQVASFVLALRPAALCVSNLAALRNGYLAIEVEVTAGPGAPEWLPAKARYLLYAGDGRAACGEPIYIPFEQLPPGEREAVGVDRLMAALGKSVARANGQLAQLAGAGGTSLIASVTLQVNVASYEVQGQERLLLALAPPGQATGQTITVTLTTVPGAEP